MVQFIKSFSATSGRFLDISNKLLKKSSLFFLKRLFYPIKTFKWLPFLAVHEYVMKYLLIFGTILSKMCQKWRGRVISWQFIRFVERLQNYSTTNNYLDNGWKIEIESKIQFGGFKGRISNEKNLHYCSST